MHHVSLEKDYTRSADTIMDLFHDHRFFQLTGADTIETTFKVGGPFRLLFEDRGKIYGHFVKITDDEIILDWNVEGFNRPNEVATVVTVNVKRLGGGCKITLTHTNIQHSVAAAAKKKAWTEILDDVEKIVSVR